MVHNITSMARLVNQGMREWGIALHGIGNTVEEAKQGIGRGYGFPQILYMSCGYKDKVESIEQVPRFNVPCPCGNSNHWIVKYDLIKQPFYRRTLNWVLRLFS